MSESMERCEREKFSSDETGKLMEALAKAQGEMEAAKTDSSNPYFKSRYADLASVVKASRPVLAKHGLCVMQRLMTDDSGCYLYTRLGHTSGQWIESKAPINPMKKDAQALGSEITYFRRYAYSALVGVVATGEDDDGERAMAEVRASSHKTVGTKATKATEARNDGKDAGTISKAQLETIRSLIGDDVDLVDRIVAANDLTILADLPKSEFSTVLGGLKKLKGIKDDGR